MLRRTLSLMLLAIIALPLVGGMAFAFVSLAPCPDDTAGESCPPVCAVCRTCTQAQPAIVNQAACSAIPTSSKRIITERSQSASSQGGADIFHVPLLG